MAKRTADSVVSTTTAVAPALVSSSASCLRAERTKMSVSGKARRSREVLSRQRDGEAKVMMMALGLRTPAAFSRLSEAPSPYTTGALFNTPAEMRVGSRSTAMYAGLLGSELSAWQTRRPTSIVAAAS